MGMELSSLVAAVELKRATDAFWNDSPEPEPTPGFLRRAAKAAARAIGSAVGNMKSAPGAAAEAGAAPAGAD